MLKIMLGKWNNRFRLCMTAGDGGTGGGGGNNNPPPNGGNNNPPPNGGNNNPPSGGGNNNPPPVDVNAVAAQARLDLAKSLGFASIEEMQESIKDARGGGGTPSPADIKKRNEALELQSKQQAETIKNLRIDNDLANLIASCGKTFHSPEDFRAAVKEGVSVDNDGNIVILDKAGNAKYNAQGQKLTLKEHFEQFMTAKPYFIKTVVKGGSGQPPNSNTPNQGDAPTPEALKKKGTFELKEGIEAFGLEKK